MSTLLRHFKRRFKEKWREWSGAEDLREGATFGQPYRLSKSLVLLCSVIQLVYKRSHPITTLAYFPQKTTTIIKDSMTQNSNMTAITIALFLVLAVPIVPRHLDVPFASDPMFRRDLDVALATVTVNKAVTTPFVLTTCPASAASGVNSPGPSTRVLTTPTTNSGSARTSTTTTKLPSTMPTDANGAAQQGNHWVLPDGQKYRNRRVFTFNGDALPDGLQASADFIPDTSHSNTANIPYNHQFDPTNVRVADGFLNLIVPGGQNPTSPTPDDANGSPISSAEIITTECNIKYASVRTRAILSRVPGTCQGIFMYWDGQNEADIEVLSDPRSAANQGGLNPISVWYSNQAAIPGNEPSNDNVRFPSGADPFKEVHEYRIDWRSDRTEFFFDGVKQTTLRSNVPRHPGRFIWNNWANGDQAWSCGPPIDANIMRVQSIVMYYNTSDSGSWC